MDALYEEPFPGQEVSTFSSQRSQHSTQCCRSPAWLHSPSSLHFSGRFWHEGAKNSQVDSGRRWHAGGVGKLRGWVAFPPTWPNSVPPHSGMEWSRQSSHNSPSQSGCYSPRLLTYEVTQRGSVGIAVTLPKRHGSSREPSQEIRLHRPPTPPAPCPRLLLSAPALRGRREAPGCEQGGVRGDLAHLPRAAGSSRSA